MTSAYALWCQRQQFDHFYDCFEQESEELKLVKKKRILYNVLDNITAQMKTTFDSLEEFPWLS